MELSTNFTTSTPGTANATTSDSASMNPLLVHMFTLLYISASVIGSFANLSILAAFFTVRKLRTRVNYFLASLALSDLIMLMLYLPFEIEWHIRTIFKHSAAVCDFVYTMFFVTISSSCLNLMAVSGYRYLTIVYPFCSKQITKKQLSFVVALIWFYSFVSALLPVMGWRDVPTIVVQGMCWFQYRWEFIVILMGLNWMLPALVVFIFYAMIFRIARIQAHKIAKSQVVVEHERKRNKHLMKGAISLAKIVGVYLVCWFPYIIIGFVGQIVLEFVVPSEIHYFVTLLVYSNAAINPFLYAGLCEDFKVTFRKFAKQVSSFLRSTSRNIRCFVRRAFSCFFCKSLDSNRNEGSRRSTRNTGFGSGSSLYQQAATMLSSA